MPKPGYEGILKLKGSIRSLANLNDAIDYALLDVELLQLLKDTDINGLFIHFLLDKYFPTSKNQFNPESGNPSGRIAEIEDKILHEPPEDYRQEIRKLIESKDGDEIFFRGSIFKREVPKIYNYSCSISGMRISAIANVSMVDACHIIPFSESFDDTISNGLALCPNLHRAFDRGLISIDDNYRVLINTNWYEDESDYSIKHFEGKMIILPGNRDNYPSQSNLHSHRKRWGFAN